MLMNWQWCAEVQMEGFCDVWGVGELWGDRGSKDLQA